MEESVFVEKIRERDEHAIRSVVDTYADQIVRAARGAGLDQSDAEEVTQATFVTFVETAPRFEGRSKVRTWLFGILYRKIAEMRRQLGRERDVDPIDETIEERFDAGGRWQVPPEPADALVLNREVREEIRDCLNASPLRQRMAFMLREVEGLETTEIEEILGVNANNLGVLLYRIRNRLRDCMRSKGFN